MYNLKSHVSKSEGLKIGNLVASLPIVQGGMSISVSTAPLAAAVANAGGVGTIGGAGITIPQIQEQIAQAKKLAPRGIVGINLMAVARNFDELVTAAAETGVDFIVSGAGFSRNLFVIGRRYDVPIISIVSSVKAAKLALRCQAAAIVVEGKEAGGHLGTNLSIKTILPPIVAEVKSQIPVIAAGGITTPEDVREMIDLGADAVQVASRFILSEECEVHPAYKEVHLKAKKEDIVLITSPVGLPGRAIRTSFVERLLRGDEFRDYCPRLCMKQCTRFYCINERLVLARNGDIKEGLVFSGENSWKNDKIEPAKDILADLARGLPGS